MTTNFIKKIVDKTVSEEVHNAFTRYSLGEFVKEPFLVKMSKKDITVQTGFEYLNFMHKFLAENLKCEVELSGTIESVKDLGPNLNKLGLKYEDGRRFGKPGSKFILLAQKVGVATYKKLVADLFTEYLLFNVSFTGGLLKVKKQTTPKLGSQTLKFVTVKLPTDLLGVLKSDYLFDFEGTEFKDLVIEQTYQVDDVVVDDKLLLKDANLARRNALRSGEIHRKLTVDDAVVKDYKIKFKV